MGDITTCKSVEPIPASLLDASVPVHRTPDGTEYVRTPDACFADLPGYPFTPQYADIDGLRMHYVDEGPADGDVVLLIHGQPTWSYLHRKMVPTLAAAGHRAIAIDLMGLGRSDKPVDLRYHTFERHVANIKAFIEGMDLRDITLYGQDWGGATGLRIVGDLPDLFARVVVSNTGLPIMETNPFGVPDTVVLDPDGPKFAEFAMGAMAGTLPFQEMFQSWITWALTSGNFRPGEMVNMVTRGALTDEEISAYNAPYPSAIYSAGPRTLPSMLAGITTQNAPAWESLGRFEKPFLFLAGNLDVNFGTEESQDMYTAHVPGAQGLDQERFEAGHFIQEEIGETLADRINGLMAATPAG